MGRRGRRREQGNNSTWAMDAAAGNVNNFVLRAGEDSTFWRPWMQGGPTWPQNPSPQMRVVPPNRPCFWQSPGGGHSGDSGFESFDRSSRGVFPLLDPFSSNIQNTEERWQQPPFLTAEQVIFVGLSITDCDSQSSHLNSSPFP